MIDFNTLEKLVQGQYASPARTFTFAPTSYASPGIDDLLRQYIKLSSIVLTDVAAPPTSDSAHGIIRVTGTCDALVGFTKVSTTLAFFLDAGVPQIGIEIGLPEGWTFSGAFPILERSVFDDIVFSSGSTPLYVYASAPFADPTLKDGGFVTGLNFWGEVAPNGDAFGALGTLLGAFTSTTAVGPIDIPELAPTTPNITLALGLSSTLSHLVPILKNGIHVALTSSFSVSQGDLVGIVLSTTFDFGTQKHLTLSTVIEPWLTTQVIFQGLFEGFPLPSPTEFIDDFKSLFGGADLVSSLPSPYHSSPLSLQQLTLGISLAPSVSVSIVIVELDNDAAQWSLDGLATIEKVTIGAGVQNPFASDGSRTWLLHIGGTVSIPTADTPVVLVGDAAAEFGGNAPARYSLDAHLAANSTLTVPIGSLLKKYVSLDVAPDFKLSELSFALQQQSPKTSYAFRAALDTSTPPSFSLGGTKAITITEGVFHIESGTGDKLTGGIEGGLELFDVRTAFSYDVPGGFKMSASFPSFEVDIAKLIDGLVGIDWKAPDWFPTIDFPKTALYLAYDDGNAGSTYTFALRADPSFGTIVFQVVKRTNWAFAAGLALNAPKIAAFPGLASLSFLDDFFAVDELVFIFASADINGFQFPPTASFGSTTGPNVALPTGTNLRAGFFFYGQMTLNLDKTPSLKMAQGMFGLPPGLVFGLTVFIGENPEQNAYAQAALQGTVRVNGHDLVAIQGVIGGRIEDGEPQIYVEGVVSTNVSGTSLNSREGVTGAVSFSLTENAAFLAASLIGSVTFGPLTVSDLVIVVGIDAEEIPSVGFAAQLDLSAYGATYDSSLALFFDSGDPGKSLIAGAISDLNLGDVLKTIVGVITQGADAPPSWLTDVAKQIALTGLELTKVPASVAADLDAKAYTKLNADLSALGVQLSEQTSLIIGPKELGTKGVWYITDYPASGTIKHYELQQQGGEIVVKLEPQLYYCMPPGGGSVTLGPPNHGIVFNAGVSLFAHLQIFMLEITASLDIEPNRGLSASLDLDHALVIVKDFIGVSAADSDTKGPKFSVSTFTQGDVGPHLSLSGKLTFLGLSATATVQIDSHGLLLKLSESVGTATCGAGYTVSAKIDSPTDFSLGFQAGVHINDPEFKLWSLDLGTLPVKLDLDCDLTFGAKNGALFLKMDDVDFKFGGVGFTIPGFELDVSTSSLKDLPGIIYDAVKNLFWDFLKDAEHWLIWVGDEIIKGVEDIEKVLKDVFHALESVWSNDRRIVVAVHENLTQSQSTTITITPATPTDGVTADMIDEAKAWAQATLENLVTTAVMTQLRTTPPEDIGNFKVSTLQNIDESFTLSEDQTWLMRPAGALPTLVSLGFENPAKDGRFFATTTAARQLSVSVAIVGDFNVLQSVKVTATYGGKPMGGPYTFTSNIAHRFTAPWSTADGDAFTLAYVATYVNGATPPVTSPPLWQQGTSVNLIVET